VRFSIILCLMGLLMSVTTFHAIQAASYSSTCVSPYPTPPTSTYPIPTPLFHIVFINEVLLATHTGWNCAYQSVPNQQENAWIELYNPLAQPLDLYAERTYVDRGPNTQSFRIPFGSVIPARGFFTFFPYISGSFSLLNTSTLRLFMGVPTILIDNVTIPNQLPTDSSYARVSDGNPNWHIATAPTINSSNTPPVTVVPVHPTPTPLRAKRSSTSKTSNKSSQTQSTPSTTNTATQIQPATGTQPVWHSLQFPLSPTATPVSDDSATIPTDQSVASTSPNNVPQKILFTCIGLLIAFMLWLGWRRFFKKM
jgi:hypothetical protein